MASSLYTLDSRSAWVADGVTTVWNFSFASGYIDIGHVKAMVIDGVSATLIPLSPSDFIGPNTIRILPAVATGKVLVVYRQTPKNAPLVDFADGARISEASLDIVAKQGVFIAAEALDSLNVSSETDLALAVGTATRAAIAASESAAAALAVANRTVSVTEYGAVGDGVTDDTAAIQAALQSGAKRVLFSDGTYAVLTPVSVVLSADLEMYGAGSITYVGASNTNPMVTVQCAGYSLKIDGIKFSGSNLIAGGLKIENTAAMSSSNPASLVLMNCVLQNFRMNTPSIWSLGAYIAGSFESVEIRRNRVSNITRAAGTGTPGSNGTTGIYVTQYDSARWVRNCTHTENTYFNVTGDDAVGSANNVDFDGFKFYAPNPTYNDNIDNTVSSYMSGTCLSFGNSYRNVRGRAVKIQAIGHVRDEKVIRDADYTILGGSSEINLQYGAGTVRDVEFFYSDYAGPTSPIQTAGHSLVVFYQGAWYDEDNGGCSASGIRVYNNIKSGIGNNIAQIVNAQVGATVLGKNRPMIRVSDVVVNRGDVDWILTVSGTAGANGLVVMEDVSVSKLTYSAIGSAYTNPDFKLIARGVYNLDGVTTPGNAKKFVTSVSPAGGDMTWSGVMDGHGVHGFLNTFNRGADYTSAPLLVGGGLTGTGLGGAASVQNVGVADGASYTFDRRFFNSSRGVILVSVNYDYTSQGLFACGSNGVYQLAAHASNVFSASTTGANLDTAGKLNMWFTGGSLNIKNRLGSTFYVTVLFVG